MNEKKMWSFAGIFMTVLILTLPFYSANSLAISLQITKNEGITGIEHYIDGEGDVWTVEALITDAGDDIVDPENVRLKIGENDAAFKTCSDSTLGTTCEYISPLTDGVREDEYAFQVIYNFLNNVGDSDSVSDGDYIRVDGSAPTIHFYPGDVRQDSEGKVRIDFTVDDKKEGVPAVGLKYVEVLDGDTGTVLLSIPNLNGQEKFSYWADTDYNGILDVEFTGEGKKRIKIRAEDMLGHKITSMGVSFDADFVKPQLVGELNLTKFGQFIGEFTGKTDVMIDVLERSVPAVIAYSDQADLSGKEAKCVSDVDVDDLWHCTWKNVEVRPESRITLLVIAEDESGNRLEEKVSKSLTVDESPPKIKFFGTVRQFEDRSYLKAGEFKIILRAEDDGAGIDESGIRANLGAFGLSHSVKPKECVEEDGIVECYWEIDDDHLQEGVLIFGLSAFKDKVGNEGDMPEYEFIVDNTGPKVEEIEVYGYSEAGDKAYFQSNDVLKMKLKISESSGLNILVNVNDLVMDAENSFPEDEFIPEDGWQRFTEESCEREEGFWECVVETDPIKSGPDMSARLEIKVQDTAGNDAALWKDEPENVKDGNEGEYRIEIAGLITEDNPDYWEVRKDGAVPAGGISAFIDLDTAPLTYTRLPFGIILKRSAENVEALNIELIDCLSAEEAGEEDEEVAAGPSPQISRSILYGGLSPKGDPSPTPNLILEFEPFDGRSLFSLTGLFEAAAGVFEKVEVEYVCQLKIFSKVGKNAVKAPEIQEVRVVVPFGFTELGKLDENLAAMIDQAREDAEMTFFEVIGVLTTILKWVDYLIQVYQIVVDIIHMFQFAGSLFEPVRSIPQGTPAAIGACFGFNTASEWADEGIHIIDVIVQVLTCSPRADRETGEFATGWYGEWQSTIMDWHNNYLRDFFGNEKGMYMPRKSLRDNMALSVVGLCLPGLIMGVDRGRQILCRKVMCLENEVAAGLATVSMCDALESLLLCKYVFGEIWYLISPFDIIDMFLNSLANAIKDPFAIAHTLTIVGCGIACLASNEIPSACVIMNYVWDFVAMLDRIVGFVQTMIAEFDSGGLKYCDAVL